MQKEKIALGIGILGTAGAALVYRASHEHHQQPLSNSEPNQEDLSGDGEIVIFNGKMHLESSRSNPNPPYNPL